MKLLLPRCEHDALVLSQVLQPKVRRPAVTRVLPRQHLPVPGHGARKTKQIVQTTASPFTDTGVADSAHKHTDLEVPTPHAHMTQLIHRLRSQNHVVHNDQHVPNLALLQKFLLLCEQRIDKRLIPRVKKEAWVPLGVPFHHGFQNGAARRGSHETNHQIEIIKQSVHEVHRRCALSAPPGAYRREDAWEPVSDSLGVPSLEHFLPF